MSMITTMTSKGQVTLPVEARRRMGLKPGSKLQVLIRDDDRLEVIPMADSITSLKGMLGKAARRLSLKQMDDAIAGGPSA